MADVSPVTLQAQKQAEMANAGVGQILANTSEIDKLYALIGQTARTLGSDSYLVELTKQTADLRTQEVADLSAASLGTDLRSSTNILVGENEALLQSLGLRKEALAAVNAKNSVGLFDNPLEWVLNQLTVNDDIARYNAANAAVEQHSNTIATLTAATDRQVATQKLLKHSVTQASAEAAARAAASQAQIMAIQADISGYQNNTAGIKAATEMNSEALRAKQIIFSVQQQAQDSARSAFFQGEHLKLAQAEEARKMEVWSEAKAERDVKKADLEEQAKTINLGLLNLGRTPLQGSAMVAFLGRKAPDGSPAQEVQMAYASGRATQSMGRKVVAVDPASLAEIDGTIGINFTAIQRPIKQAMDGIRTQVANELKTPGKELFGKSKDQAAIAARVNQLTKTQFGLWAKNIIPGDIANPYQVGSISDIIKLPAVAQIPVVQKVLLPMLATPQGAKTLDDPVQFSQLIHNALENKTITFNQALAVPEIFRRAAEANNAARQFKALGLPENLSYNSRAASLFNFSTSVDFADDLQWSRYLAKYAIASLVPAPALRTPDIGLKGN